MLLIIFAVIVVVLYLYGTRTFNYWSKRGVKHDKPVPFFGNYFRQYAQRASLAMLATEMYRKYPNEKVVGFFVGHKPQLIIRDPEIIKRILSTDFEHFYARDDDDSQFRELGKRIMRRSLRDGLAGALKSLFPELCKNMNLMAEEVETSMGYLVQTALKERGHKPSGRNDFIDMLLEFRSQGEMIGESIEKKNSDGTAMVIRRELDDVLIMAQVFIFFSAGFETSSGASSYLLHQLAFNPDCQEKVQEEIDRVLKKHNNKITYEAVKEMTYLEMAFNEGMRIYPSVGYLARECRSASYTIPEINLTINDGVKIMIPVQALLMDEKYFDNPEKFDPERFNPELKLKQNRKFVFMPFGAGPRACVGERMGLMQAMAGVAAVLQKFTVEPAACSLRIPLPEPAAIVTEGIRGGLPLKFKKRVK